MYGLDETDDNIKFVARVVRDFCGVGFMSSYKFVYDQSCDSVFFLATDEEDANFLASLVFHVGKHALGFLKAMSIMVLCSKFVLNNLELM